MGLLWKHDPPVLPFNRPMAEIRLRHLKRRLERDKDLHERYRSVVDGYIAKGHASKLTKEEAERRSNKTWYLPHHPVTSPNKPGKVRVVFDAAAKFQGTSLNAQLLQGPDYINNLAGVLMRFRQEEIAITADIEQMFHQVQVPAEDCDAYRFLWWSKNLNDEPEEYQMQVHIFGATSSPCCSNKALWQTTDDNEDKYGKEVAETVRRNFYVDDLLKSIQTISQAATLAVQVTSMLKDGGFHLTKFLSNRREVLHSTSSWTDCQLTAHWVYTGIRRETFSALKQYLPTSQQLNVEFSPLSARYLTPWILVSFRAPGQGTNTRSLKGEDWMG